MSLTRSDELDLFKRRINLTEYAAAQGYVLDRKASSRNSALMHGPSHDKVVIAINRENGHWMYFSIRDDTDCGTIVDFVQNRQRCPLGEVRKLLRPWIGESSQPPQRPSRDAYAARLEPSNRDLARVAVEYARMSLLKTPHAWLENERNLPAHVLNDPRFQGKMRMDARHNVIFPHYNTEGLCGFELKNRNFTGFARGGQKGLWTSAAYSTDTALVITEGAIDALSYHALHRPAHTRYISTGGSLNPDQPALITATVRRLPPEGTVILATDQDEGGDALMVRIRALLQENGVAEGLQVREHRPEGRGDDWNDVLRAQSPPRVNVNNPVPGCVR